MEKNTNPNDPFTTKIATRIAEAQSNIKEGDLQAGEAKLHQIRISIENLLSKGDQSRNTRALLATVLNQLSLVYKRRAYFEESLVLLKQVLTIEEELNISRLNIAITHLNMSSIEFFMNDLTNGVKNANVGKDLLIGEISLLETKRTNDPFSIALKRKLYLNLILSYFNRAIIQEQLHEIESSKENYDKCTELCYKKFGPDQPITKMVVEKLKRKQGRKPFFVSKSYEHEGIDTPVLPTITSNNVSSWNVGKGDSKSVERSKPTSADQTNKFRISTDSNRKMGPKRWNSVRTSSDGRKSRRSYEQLPEIKQRRTENPHSDSLAAKVSESSNGSDLKEISSNSEFSKEPINRSSVPADLQSTLRSKNKGKPLVPILSHLQGRQMLFSKETKKGEEETHSTLDHIAKSPLSDPNTTKKLAKSRARFALKYME